MENEAALLCHAIQIIHAPVLAQECYCEETHNYEQAEGPVWHCL